MFVRASTVYRCPDPHCVETNRCLACTRCILNNHDDETKEDGPPPPPTKARPGSEAKVRVLEWRIQHDFALWSPEDEPA